jgi:hypothetical protein
MMTGSISGAFTVDVLSARVRVKRWRRVNLELSPSTDHNHRDERISFHLATVRLLVSRAHNCGRRSNESICISLNSMIENEKAETALGTIGAVLWTIQIIPQLVKSYRTKDVEGLSAMLML